MGEQIIHWKTTDGAKLGGRHWPTTGQPIAVVALVHGLGEHCCRYQHVAESMNRANIAVMAMDMRGHGLSEGKRGHIPSFDIAMEDISLLIREIQKEYPDSPVFLYGHSMGGLLALYWGLKNDGTVKGIVSSSPGLQPGVPIAPVKKILGKILYNFVPMFTMDNGLKLEGLSRDPIVISVYKNDPLVHPYVSARLGIDILEKGELVLENASKFRHPLLLLQGGEDVLVSPKATQAFAQKLSGRVTFSWWEGAFHELHNEPEKDQVIQTIINWIKSQR